MNSNLSPAEYSYQELLRVIGDGTFAPGDRLSALALAKRFGVSRTPVIQALKVLEAEGIVSFCPGSGARLINPTAKEICDTYLVRGYLEVLALELGFENMDAPRKIRLEKQIALEKAYFREGEKISCIRSGLDFHRELAMASENSRLISYVENILKATFVYLVLLEPKNYAPSSVHPDEHAHLLDLILQGKKKEACSFLEKHIEESRCINIPFLDELSRCSNPCSRNARIKACFLPKEQKA
ncbi:MAG TPA: GntR family transcriptional regulator [Synergistaceae bacterium]|nr:GntR family transcriptional regulator [Synergistaceae bacterium]